MITHDATTNTWGFTHGAQSYTGYESREAAQEALYDAERGTAPLATTFARKREIFRQFDEIFGLTDEGEGDEESFGALTDGTPIIGFKDRRDPTGRTGVVSAYGDDWRFSAQDEPNLISIHGFGININDATIEKINALRALLATDLPEQMLAAGVAYGRGDAGPPALPTAVRVVPDICDDEIDRENYGKERGIELHCGDACTLVYFPHSGQPPLLFAFGQDGFDLREVDRILPDIITLLNDPRVRAARARWAAGLPAIDCERAYELDNGERRSIRSQSAYARGWNDAAQAILADAEAAMARARIEVARQHTSGG